MTASPAPQTAPHADSHLDRRHRTAAPDVEIIGVTKRFGDVTAVDEMDLRIARGEFYSLLGPSGCGKTTTLRMIAGFEQPTEGEILLAGPADRRRPAVPAQRQHGLPALRAVPAHGRRPNVGYGLRQRKVGKATRRGGSPRRSPSSAWSATSERRTWEMSGGQQQRVALARALVNRPTVLLLDEPLGALDLKLRKEMQLELKALQREVGITFVYVTHDQEEALTMSDVIVVMRDGRIQQQGGPAELYEQPVNRFVADFIGTSNFMPGTVAAFDAANASRTVRTDRGLTIRGRVTDAAATRRAGRRGHRRHPPGTPGGRAGRRARGAECRRLDIGTGAHPPGHLSRRSDRVPGPDRPGGRARRPPPERNGDGTSQGMGPGDPVVVRWLEEANLVLVA